MNDPYAQERLDALIKRVQRDVDEAITDLLKIVSVDTVTVGAVIASRLIGKISRLNAYAKIVEDNSDNLRKQSIRGT